MSRRRQTCSAVSASPRPTGRSWKFPVTAAEARGQPPASDACMPDPAEGRGLRGVALGTVGGGLGVPPHVQEPRRGCSRRRGRGQAVCLRKSRMCPQNATCEACPCGGRGGRPGPHTDANAGASRQPAPPLSGIDPGKCRGGGAGDLPPHPRLPPRGSTPEVTLKRGEQAFHGMGAWAVITGDRGSRGLGYRRLRAVRICAPTLT